MKKNPGRAMLLVVCLAVLLVPGVSAFNLSRISIDPTGSLIPDTQVNISGLIDFPTNSEETFPSGDALVFTTDLADPKWTSTLILDSVEKPENPVSGKTFNLSGFELAHPETVRESLKFSLEGTAPYVQHTSTETLLQIRELDSREIPIPGRTVEYNVLVIDTCPNLLSCVSLPIKDELESLHASIDDNSSRGIDTSAAEAEYNRAEQEIASAREHPTNEYEVMFSDLTTAQAAINEGEIALDKAWAEKTITDAQERVDRADKMIGWFRGNQSTSNDARLTAIISKREMAANYVSQAKENIYLGNYTVARVKAQEGYQRANESYTDALSEQYKIQFSPCLGCGMVPFPKRAFFVAGIGAIVILIVGVIWWRKKKAVKPE